jgi:hypothetical protein
MARQSPAKKTAARVGQHATEDVDTTGFARDYPGVFDSVPDTVATKPKGGGILNTARGALKKMGQGFGRMMGNRPDTPAEEEHYKNVGKQNYYNAKIKKDFQK